MKYREIFLAIVFLMVLWAIAFILSVKVNIAYGASNTVTTSLIPPEGSVTTIQKDNAIVMALSSADISQAGKIYVITAPDTSGDPPVKYCIEMAAKGLQFEVPSTKDSTGTYMKWDVTELIPLVGVLGITAVDAGGNASDPTSVFIRIFEIEFTDDMSSILYFIRPN